MLGNRSSVTGYGIYGLSLHFDLDYSCLLCSLTF